MLSGYDTRSRDLAWFHGCLAAERAEVGLGFNPLADSFQRAPEVVYTQLRERSPVHFSRLLDCWIVTRYREVDHVLRTNEVFLSDPHSTTQELVDPYVMLAPDSPSLFMLDPPGHTRLRGAVQGAFSAGAVERLAPLLRKHIGQVVEALGRPGDEVDLVSGFAEVVPLRVLGLVTGLDLHDENRITGWVSAVVRALEPIATRRTAAESLAAYDALGAYLDEQRSRPAREGTLCRALRDAVSRGRVSDAEARQLLLFLVLAGTKTVSDLLASAARYLTALPVHARERRHVDSAVVEGLLARTSPVQIVARTAAVPAVLDGVQIRSGQRLLLVLASANDDRARSGTGTGPAGPESSHIAFGRGIHRCLGAHLARLQGRLALAMLLDRFPGVRLVDATRARRCLTLRSWDSVLVHL